MIFLFLFIFYLSFFIKNLSFFLKKICLFFIIFLFLFFFFYFLIKLLKMAKNHKKPYFIIIFLFYKKSINTSKLKFFCENLNLNWIFLHSNFFVEKFCCKKISFKNHNFPPLRKNSVVSTFYEKLTTDSWVWGNSNFLTSNL